MTIQKENIRRILIGVVLLLIVFTFFLVNAQQYAFAFLIYIVVGGLSVFLYSFWERISSKGDLEGLSKNWVRNLFIGIGFGIATLVIGSFIPFIGAIGIPQVSASIVGTLGRFLIIVIAAPIFESVFFLDIVTDFFESKLGLNKWLSVGIMSLLAALFHYTAYGSSLQQASGSFFSAAIMFFLFGLVTELQNDLAAPISWHMVLNLIRGGFLAIALLGFSLIPHIF